MAVIHDSDDKMRDIIAQHAAELTDGDGDTGAEGEGEAAGAIDDDGAAPVAVADDAVAEGEGEGEAAAVVEAKAVVPGATADIPVVDKQAAPGTKAKKEEDAFAKEHGLKATDGSGRVNRIPYPVIRDRIVPNAIKKEKATWEATVLKPATERVALYEGRLKSIEATEKIMFDQPRRYVAMLQSIPGYKELFDEISGGKFTAGVENASKEAVGTKIADDPEPQPDARDKDGKVVGWTEEGLAKARAWDRRQAAKEARETTLAEVDKRYKPLQDRFSAVVADEQTAKDIDGIIGIAAAWPGFTDNVTAILDEVGKGTDALTTPQKMYQAVQNAYNVVMFGTLGKVKETEEERRDRYFTEFQTQLRKAPRSTAARTTVRRDEPVDEGENASPDDRMRNLIVESARRDGLLK